MAESADDPELFWVDPQRRGILPLDGFHLSRRQRPRGPPGPLRGPGRQRLHGGAHGLRRGDREAAEHLDQHRDRAALHRAFRAGRGAQRRVLAGGAAGRRPLRRVDRRRILWREHVQPHGRRQQGSAGASRRAAAARRISPARPAIRDPASDAVWRGRGAARAIPSVCSPRRCAISAAFPRGLGGGAGRAARARAAACSAPCRRARSRHRPDARAPTAPGSRKTSSR